jgi:hypothetical protein
MPETVADLPDPSCSRLLSESEIQNLNYLVLIPLCLTRATASPGQAPATRAPGHPASPSQAAWMKCRQLAPTRNKHGPATALI